MTTKAMTLNTSTIGGQSWKNSTLKGIKLSRDVMHRSDKANDAGRSLDPLPHIRDTVADLSNLEAHTYFRQARAVVSILRESLLETNTEIKALTRTKEAVEKASDHIRKDLKLNQESVEVRINRPSRELEHDGADDLISAERMHLLNIKKMLETQLHLVKEQLQTLDTARHRLSRVIQERSRVLDMVCQSGSALTRVSSNMGTVGVGLAGGRTTSGTALGPDRAKTALNTFHNPMPPPDPLGAYTPEADTALQDGTEARDRSQSLRNEVGEAIMRAINMQKAAHRSVNSGLTQKVSETVHLKQHLNQASGENRYAIYRSQRWYDATDLAWGYTRGPARTSDLNTRERLDRPIMQIMQRHPGTTMPEAHELVTSGDGLLESLTATKRNIGLLKLTRQELEGDIRDKSKAINTDGNIVRMRRRKANHRWILSDRY